MYKVLLLNKQIQFYGSTKTNPMIFSRLSKTKLLMLENFGLKIIFTDEHEESYEIEELLEEVE